MKRAHLLFVGLIVAGTLRASAVSASAVREAQTALAAGHYEFAYVQWKRILSRKPGHPEALSALARLEGIAKHLLEKALQNQETVESKDLLRTVVLISDPGSGVNREARLLLGDDL